MRCIAMALVLAGLCTTGVAHAQDVTVNKEKKQVIVACKVAPRKLPNLSEIYPLEVIASWGHEHKPPGRKAHETVVTFEALPSEIHKALESLGLKPGKPAVGEGAQAAGPEVKISLEIPAEGGAKVIPIEQTLVDKKTGKPMPALKWHFTGSAMKNLDPEKDDKSYGADATGTLVALFPVTDDTVVQTSLTLKEEKLIKLDVNKAVLPAEGTAVKLIIEAK